MALSDTPVPSGNLDRPLPAGTVARTVDPVFWLIGGLLALLAGATMLWGLPVLAMTALAMVPVVFVLLIAVTLG